MNRHHDLTTRYSSQLTSDLENVVTEIAELEQRLETLRRDRQWRPGRYRVAGRTDHKTSNTHEPAPVVAGSCVSSGWSPTDRRSADKLGFAPARTVVCEDSTAGAKAGAAGAKAGAAAGATIIGVGPRGLVTDATVVIRDLRGLTWHDGILSLSAADLLRF
ncbi:hypothetical protein [Streptomyces sp. NPDC056982]|uniref:hypothetical protein n=1 Tax=Streptomyces sp. NPDC056982 TaxID=3345986 RepID=UPI00363AE634